MSTEVTKEWLAAKVAADPFKVIGRALSAIYDRQMAGEQSSTKFANGIGFSKPDARIGGIGARQYCEGKLQQWVVDVWLKPAKDDLPRICKYANQLNDIAQSKRLANTGRFDNWVPEQQAINNLFKPLLT